MNENEPNLWQNYQIAVKNLSKFVIKSTLCEAKTK